MALNDLFTDFEREALAPLEQDILRGEQVRAALALNRQRRLEEAQSRIRHACVEGLGQLEMRVDGDLYMRMVHLHGQGCWQDDGFRSHMRKANPGMFRPHSEPRTVTLTMPGFSG